MEKHEDLIDEVLDYLVEIDRDKLERKIYKKQINDRNQLLNKQVTKIFDIRLGILESIDTPEKVESSIFTHRVLNLDDSEIGRATSEESAINLFLSVHPIFDRDAVKSFIYNLN